MFFILGAALVAGNGSVHAKPDNGLKSGIKAQAKPVKSYQFTMEQLKVYHDLYEKAAEGTPSNSAESACGADECELCIGDVCECPKCDEAGVIQGAAEAGH